MREEVQVEVLGAVIRDFKIGNGKLLPSLFQAGSKLHELLHEAQVGTCCSRTLLSPGCSGKALPMCVAFVRGVMPRESSGTSQ